MKVFISTLMLLLGAAFVLQGQDASEIVRKSEERGRGIKSLQAEMIMTIVRPEWTREMRMKTWSQGNDYAMVLISAPARDVGTANLKRKREIWTWVPRTEQVVKLPPSMLSQSWMGSDFTNEDLVREFSLSNDYTHKLMFEESIEGRPCYKIELTPKPEAAVVWGIVYLWIDKENYNQMHAEFYDEEQQLVNTMHSSKVKTMDGRLIPTRMEMIPADKKGHKTVLEYSSMQFDRPMSEAFFTIQNMKRLR